MTESQVDPKTEIQMKALVEQLSAYIETFHGGSAEYISFDGKVLKVHLGGSCLGCPLIPRHPARLGGRDSPAIFPGYQEC